MYNPWTQKIIWGRPGVGAKMEIMGDFFNIVNNLKNKVIKGYKKRKARGLRTRMSEVENTDG